MPAHHTWQDIITKVQRGRTNPCPNEFEGATLAAVRMA
jgi:hypothetical protein